MEVLEARCAGVEVQKQPVVACVLTSTATGTAAQEGRTFGTRTRALAALAGGRAERQVAPVARASRGVVWWPVYNILAAAGLPVTLGTPRATQVPPGHKTDTGEAVWWAALLRQGLVRASLIPPADRRARRDLTRSRATQVRARAREVKHLRKPLASATRTLANVAPDPVGGSGRAQLAKAGVRKKLDARERAFSGRGKPHQQVLLRASRAHRRCLERTIDQRDQEVARATPPFAAQLAALAAVPGIGTVAAAASGAESGVAMGRFPPEGHRTRGAGVCPGNQARGGRRRSRAPTKGPVWLRRSLGEGAWAAVHARGRSFRARSDRLQPRRGAQQALVAIRQQILKLLYHILKTGDP